MKGDGETHPFLSPNDEFADFETWDKGNLNLSEAKTPEMLRHEYARSALLLGMQLEQEFGTNPYAFGMIGSTDSHTGLAAVEEDNFWGKVTPMEPNAERLTNTFISDPGTGLTLMEWEVSSAGYAAVWAQENTRASIFDAMERREVYATTGTRMTVRFFGGYDFAAGDAASRNPAVIGYGKGVPMGGRAFPDRRAAHRPSLSPRSAIRSARTSTATRSSRAGSTPRAPRRSASTTSPGRTAGCRARTASSRPWAARSRAPPGPTPSARPNSSPSGPIPTSTPASGLLLRPRDRDPDAPLDRLRRRLFRHHAPARER
jgi:hypothetical protein